jgi:hypothetical protein
MTDTSVIQTASPNPGFRLVKSEVVPVTSAKAHEFRNMKPSPTERELNDKRVNYLFDQFKGGKARRFDWAVATLGDDTFRMNGQHSSHALCRLDGEFPDGLMACIDQYEVTSKEGLAVLFRQFDPAISTRGPDDVSGAYQGLYNELADVPRKLAKLGAEGICWYRSQIEEKPYVPTGNDRYSVFADADTYDFLKWQAELLTIKAPELARAAVVAAMYGCFMANEGEARAWWSEVARTSSASDETTQSTVLDNWLVFLKDADRQEERPDVSPKQLFQGCVFAWNAFRDDKAITTIKYNAKKMPPIKE